MAESVVVIPARLASTRFPNKPLVDLMGRPMIEWVVDAARRADVGEVIVATPDQEIIDACQRIGVRSMLTSLDHATGTDRLAEVSRSLDAEIIVNVQGDEPLMEPASIRACVEPLLSDRQVQMGSVYAECPEAEIENPAVVKVALALNSDALYFSRHPIPYARNERVAPVYKHIGLYAYRRDVLASFSTWEQTPLELAESLEQLRFLEHGVRIRMSRGRGSALAVDTPEQAEEVRRILAGLQGS